eukprot:TRINITY_DN320_c0_g2_i1.p10 TRINITY_DN320_c0_g2~~TRINITY_DN320_c0_g2_i1.p10  ORF type:complete len:108 (+),score=4.49 TRINITY_DN320_c0_g2_i1:1315-1638(+)
MYVFFHTFLFGFVGTKFSSFEIQIVVICRSSMILLCRQLQIILILSRNDEMCTVRGDGDQRFGEEIEWESQRFLAPCTFICLVDTFVVKRVRVTLGMMAVDDDYFWQ